MNKVDEEQNPSGQAVSSPITALEWQSIEIAPRDGTEILLSDGIDVFAGRRYDPPAGSGRWLDYWGHEWEPTHWMPLPAAPEVNATERETENFQPKTQE